MDKNQTDRIIKVLSETSNPRKTIYLDEEDIDGFYAHRLAAVMERFASGQFDTDVTPLLEGLIESETAREHEPTVAMPIRALHKAILTEYEARKSGELVDLSVNVPRPGSLLRYIGPSRIVVMDEDVTSDNTGLSDAEAEAIQEERERQHKILRFENEKISTIVWVASSAGCVLASVASSRWINYGKLASYGRRMPLGLLGHQEGPRKGIQFISPLWLWSEG